MLDIRENEKDKVREKEKNEQEKLKQKEMKEKKKWEKGKFIQHYALSCASTVNEQEHFLFQFLIYLISTITTAKKK